MLPPVTRMRPSASIDVPGQNMSWPVFATRRPLTCPVVRSMIAVCV
nr:hypothetical protein [Lentzea atacamensis]